MKARSKQAIASAAQDVNRARSKEYPKDDAHFPHYNCKPTWWCTPCRKSFKRGMWGSDPDHPHASQCPLCHGQLEASHRRPVPWSKKGRKWARRAKYKRENP